MKEAFTTGFIISVFMMLTGFYWVIYVIHEFGNLHYFFATLLYIIFSGFGAINFAFFYVGAFYLKKHDHGKKALLYVFYIPAIFALTEYLIPKLFPWYMGSCFYIVPILIQVIDITGVPFLSFLIFSIGGSFFVFFKLKNERVYTLLPLALLLFTLLYGFYKLSQKKEYKHVKTALIQANIGSLEKVKARQGLFDKVRYITERYQNLTEQSLKQNPSLIVWPETAMPFLMKEDNGWAPQLLDKSKHWKVPLVTGGYDTEQGKHFNAAFLIAEGKITDTYQKRILLAYGEYMPMGDVFPKLYEWFPEVANFGRGKEFKTFTLDGGLKLGLNICYEAIVLDFMRGLVRSNPSIQLLVNLTNDSWFGPTHEPYYHAALSTFRAVEFRKPMVRVTNTGISLVVDDHGKIIAQSQRGTEEFLVTDIAVPTQPEETFYLKFGHWFLWLCLLLLLVKCFRIYLMAKSQA